MIVLTAVRVLTATVITGVLSFVALVILLIPGTAKVFHAITRIWARLILAVFGVSVTVEGTESIVPGGTYIYVANHASMFDIPAVLAGIPDAIHIMLKKELTRVPVWGWALALSPYIVIDRYKVRSASESLQQAADAIREGRSVLIFAEGTRTRTGSLLPFKRGAFSIGARSGVPILPVAINNTFSILQKGSLNVRPAPITIRIGTALETTGREGRDGEVYLMDETRAQIESMYIEQGIDESADDRST